MTVKTYNEFGGIIRSGTATYTQLGGPLSPYNSLPPVPAWYGDTISVPVGQGIGGVNYSVPVLITPADPLRRSVTLINTGTDDVHLAPTRDELTWSGVNANDFANIVGCVLRGGDAVVIHSTAAVYGAAGFTSNGQLATFTEREAAMSSPHVGAAGWAGDTRPIAKAPNATTAEVAQLVGRQPNRRCLTIINVDGTRSVRLAPDKEKLYAGGGVTLPANGFIVLNTTAEVYVANDDTAASISVAVLAELDA